MKYSIKNMVCPRCVESVAEILREMNIDIIHIELGEVELSDPLSERQISFFANELQSKGFELIFDRESEIVNSVKSGLITYVKQLENSTSPEKLSQFLQTKTNYNYSYLSKVYSDQTGITIEKQLIKIKIERVKELLSFNKWTLSEIAWKLKYSSVQYLSNQFKQVTGCTVTEYRAQKIASRQALDQL